MRLIDADTLIHEMKKGRAEALATAVTVSFDIPGEGLLCGLNMAEKIYATAMLAVYSAPTIEAVPVVRCKDCAYWANNIRTADGMHGDCLNFSTTGADHFCAYGEKRCD